MKLSNRQYDILKYIALVALPAVTTFVIALCSIWGFPYGEQIGCTLVAIDTLLGALLQISTNKYIDEE